MVFTSMAIAGSGQKCNKSKIGKHHGFQNIVNTVDAGLVKGVKTEYGQKFLGIPYAAPPVSELRWRPPPQPHPGWKGILDATEFVPHSAQNASPFGIASMDEDCLYLNVYSPKPSVRCGKAPVLVWFHGGAFVYGQSDDYDPAEIVKQGIVTVNYRLGVQIQPFQGSTIEHSLNE